MYGVILCKTPEPWASWLTRSPWFRPYRGMTKTIPCMSRFLLTIRLCGRLCRGFAPGITRLMTWCAIRHYHLATGPMRGQPDHKKPFHLLKLPTSLFKRCASKSQKIDPAARRHYWLRRSVSLSVDDGEQLRLLGAFSFGKTTLLRS